MVFSDADLSSASPEDALRIALLAVANAVMDLADHLLIHDSPPCLLMDVRLIAAMATAASEGRLTGARIDRFRGSPGMPVGHG